MNNFLNNEKLKRLLEEYNVKLVYTLHHSMLNQIKESEKAYFSGIEYVPTEEISRYIRTSDLYVTDYSSLFYDFAFLNTPIVFYRPDFNDNTLIDYDRQDFKQARSMDKYLFNCCYDEDSAVDTIERYIKNGFVLEKENVQKLDLLFTERKNITQKLINYLEKV